MDWKKRNNDKSRDIEEQLLIKRISMLDYSIKEISQSRTANYLLTL
jgi:hypothetical protein